MGTKIYKMANIFLFLSSTLDSLCNYFFMLNNIFFAIINILYVFFINPVLNLFSTVFSIDGLVYMSENVSNSAASAANTNASNITVAGSFYVKNTESITKIKLIVNKLGFTLGSSNIIYGAHKLREENSPRFRSQKLQELLLSSDQKEQLNLAAKDDPSALVKHYESMSSNGGVLTSPLEEEILGFIKYLHEVVDLLFTINLGMIILCSVALYVFVIKNYIFESKLKDYLINLLLNTNKLNPKFKTFLIKYINLHIQGFKDINKHFMLFLLFIITIGSFFISYSLYLLLIKLTF